MARTGSFNPSLDPFGTSRGGLGRYNISGSTLDSLAQQELYAISVAWANGTATDEEYLAAIQKMVDLTNPGSAERTRYENQLRDAKYSIGRNKLVRTVNNATDSATRLKALRELEAYEKAHLGTMTAKDSEAYREQQDRIEDVGADIRKEKYADAIRRYNRGQLSTGALITLVTGFIREAGGSPDADEWEETLFTLNQRKKDEDYADTYQAYQHNRASGEQLLAAIDAQLAGLDPSSPQYAELMRNREDLVESIRRDNQSKADAKMYGKYQRGEIKDDEWVAYLAKRYEDAPEGSSEKIEAGNRLQQYVFSLSEDKLRYDLEVGKPGARNKLIALYRAEQAKANPGSEHWRALDLAIRRLRDGGAVGGGGGGGGGKGFSGSEKLIVPLGTLEDILMAAGGSEGELPPGFTGLFSIDPLNKTDAKWWDNNLRSMQDAMQDGDSKWIYYDQNGTAHEVAFDAMTMESFAKMNLAYQEFALAEAENPKQVQDRIGKIITATKLLETIGGQLTMDLLRPTMESLQKGKQLALATGNFAAYLQLTAMQEEQLRNALQLAPGEPLDTQFSKNPYLSNDQLNSVASMIATISPYSDDAEFGNPAGDKVLALWSRPGAIEEYDRDGDGFAEDIRVNPEYGYLTQTSDGFVMLQDVPEGAVVEDADGKLVPAYMTERIEAVVSIYGQPVRVWQEKQQGANATVSVWADSSDGPVTLRPDRAQAMEKSYGTGATPRPGSWTPTYSQVRDKDNKQVRAPLASFTSYERIDGVSRGVVWVSIDGNTWLRLPTSGDAPRIFLPTGYRYDADNAKWMKGDQEATLEELIGEAKWWGEGDGQWGFGAPGAQLTMRTSTAYKRDGTVAFQHAIDTRPDYIIEAEELARQTPEARAARSGYLYEAAAASDYFERHDDKAAKAAIVQRERGGLPEVAIARLEEGIAKAIENGDLVPSSLFNVRVALEDPKRKTQRDIRQRLKGAPQPDITKPYSTILNSYAASRSSSLTHLKPLTLSPELPPPPKITVPPPAPKKPDTYLKDIKPPALKPVVKVQDDKKKATTTSKPKTNTNNNTVKVNRGTGVAGVE